MHEQKWYRYNAPSKSNSASMREDRVELRLSLRKWNIWLSVTQDYQVIDVVSMKNNATSGNKKMMKVSRNRRGTAKWATQDGESHGFTKVFLKDLYHTVNTKRKLESKNTKTSDIF